MAEDRSSEEVLSDPFLKDVPVAEGYKVLDRCVLYAKLGQGGMGAVYRGRHLNLEIDVAVKCLRPDLGLGGGELVVRFKREARVAADISSENLVRVYDVAESSGLNYLIMEYVAGENVRERVRRKGALAVDEAVTIVLGAARGLAAAHARGIVHRDVKPDNILISKTGEVKLADLGLARAADAVDSLQTSKGLFMGTPQYAPPEQFESVRDVGPPGDVWAMGAVLYHCLTGEDGIVRGTPVEVMRRVVLDGFPSLSARRPDLPVELAEIIGRCTRSSPNDRYPDGRALVDALERFRSRLDGATVLADHEAGSSHAPSLVSPPPARTLARIRVATEGGAPGPESRTTVSPDAGSARTRSTATRNFIILSSCVLALIVAALGARSMGLLDAAGRGGNDAKTRPRAAEVSPPAEDLRPPVLRIEWPPAGTLISSGEIEIRGSVGDDVGPVDLQVQGRTAAIEADGRFTMRAVLPQEGTNRITLEATDAAGRKAGLELIVVRDTVAPVLRLVEPEEDDGRRPKTILVEVTDASTVTVRVNGREARVSGEGRFEGRLEASDSVLVLTARDAAGNEAELRPELAASGNNPAWAQVRPGVSRDQNSGLPMEVTDKTTGIELVLIPAGEFMMGAVPGDAEAGDDEKPQHRVVISRPFYLGKFEVTNRQYRRFRSAHGSKDFKGVSLDGDEQPAVFVSWNEARAFCDRFGFRLPTEAEWECAARGQTRSGATTRFLWGDSPDGGRGWANVLGPAANKRFEFPTDSFVFDDGFDVTAPVGRFRANEFGLHDMTGNVWEWCADWSGSGAYQGRGGGARDPEGPTTGQSRLVRGGSWDGSPRYCRLSSRSSADPANENPVLGFRVARTP
ncbi:MAG: SUMF1/EgtB/PvdO family nonheme iron enzyme [Planctomycetota bacterium]